MADAGWFTECRTRARFPVAQEPGAPLVVTLDGSLARRPKMEENGDMEALIVERFDRAWPGENCPRR